MKISDERDSLGLPPGPTLQENLNRRVGQYIRKATAFYIGLTSDYEARAKAYEENLPWDEMILLCETTVLGGGSRYGARGLEQGLIERFGGDSRCTNKGSGGEGREGEGPYCIYLLRQF